jgi:competence protein ComFC
MFKKTTNFIIDLLFPIACLGCQKSGYYICPQCSQKIERYSNKNCPFCNIFSEKGKVCQKCQKKYFLDQLLIFSLYSDPLIKRAIYLLKYSSVYLLGRDFAQFLAKIIQENFTSSCLSKSLIIPVPMHFKKQRKRGFNQTEIIGKYLSLITGIPLVNDLLEKNKNTLPQMKFRNKEERIANLQNVFSVNKKIINPKILKKRIIIIDDVVTTGTTLSNCALILKKAGFQKITGLALARQPKKIA